MATYVGDNGADRRKPPTTTSVRDVVTLVFDKVIAKGGSPQNAVGVKGVKRPHFVNQRGARDVRAVLVHVGQRAGAKTRVLLLGSK